jgi:hypothetical protein
MEEKIDVGADVVRRWAQEKELPVGRRGHLSVELTERFNRAHRKQQYVNRNPSVRPK